MKLSLPTNKIVINTYVDNYGKTLICNTYFINIKIYICVNKL